MLVDDQFVSRLLVKEILKDHYEMVSYDDARKALLNLDRLQPDLVITDLMMPGMSGFELTKAIKQRLPQIPILAVSAFTEYKSVESSVLFNDFLSKPYSPRTLKKRVDRMLQHTC